MGVNQFAYCLNNPSNLTDFTGCKPGDLFKSIDEAAADAARYIGWLSFLVGWEYSASIYSIDVTVYWTYQSATRQYNADGTVQILPHITVVEETITLYTYTSVKTDQNSYEVTPLLAPDGHDLKAFVHTHPMGSNQGVTRISPPDIYLAHKYNALMYVYGPNGQLLKYNPATEDIQIFFGFPKAVIKRWLY